MSSAVAKVQAVLDRIKEKDGKVNSIIAINPNAIRYKLSSFVLYKVFFKCCSSSRDAEVLDNEVEERGPLHGEPVLIKDNIDVAGMATTAGSLALKDNVAKTDAPVVASLKKAGAVIVAKTNLSEWANFRDGKSSSGWSAIGGLTRNPVADDDDGEPLTALGSSSGSGAAVALGLADAAIGTETDGSIICPAAICGIVGLKPTTGVLSSNGIVPISHSQVQYFHYNYSVSIKYFEILH